MDIVLQTLLLTKELSYKVNNYKRSQPQIKEPNRFCTICSNPYVAVAPLQKTCSKECRKTKDRISQLRFKHKNPEAMRGYNTNRLIKNPNAWKDKNARERSEIITTLGSTCIVPDCGVINPLHLHVDYIPTMRGTGFRHPKYKKWVMDNIKDFRLLCANHHYELTITGKIENTNITQ